MKSLVLTALSRARDTRVLEMGAGALGSAARVFAEQFPGKTPVVVADSHTMRAAGSALARILPGGRTPFVFDDPQLYAEHRYVEQLTHFLAGDDAIPVA